MKIRVHEILDRRSFSTTGEVPASAVVLDSPDAPSVAGPVTVSVSVESDKEEVSAWGTADARVGLTCSRCLSRYETPVQATIEISVPTSQTFLELDDEVRQALTLALPAKALCRTNCRGLCDRCGQNLNMGPCGCSPASAPSPFDSLKKLINKD